MADFAKASPAKHKSVLLKESIDALDLKPGEVFVDGTFGAGGHTAEVRKRFGEGVRIITIDHDPEAGADITGNFRDIDQLLGDIRPDAILLDIGISSDQLDRSGRGFSFLRDEPLDMRMSPLDRLGASNLTAADILNSWDEHAIELILRGFGEERYSRKIAKEIIETRELQPFKTTGDLVEAVERVKPRTFRDKINPATKTFQALRIAVNEELAALETGLEKAYEILNPGGRIAVISFHSLEDRIVKNFQKAKMGRAEKPVTPSEEEVRENPRSRSAKLRVIAKLNHKRQATNNNV
jgi:16S rRNA (cytosine1402-N4)-methyltransferase